MSEESEVVSSGLAVVPERAELGNIVSFLLVHVASDRHIDRFYIYHRAVEAAEELAQLGDWTKPRKSVLRFGIKKIRAICDKHQF